MQHIPRLSLALVGLSISAVLSAQPATILQETLVERSPFIPDTFRATSENDPQTVAQEPVNEGNYEFKGVYSLNGTYYFNLFNKQSQKGQWVTEEEMHEGLRVMSFDENSNRIQVSIGGRTETYELAQVSDSPMPIVTAPRAAPTNVTASATQANPTDQQKRMEALRALARRRAAANEARISRMNQNAQASQASRTTVTLQNGREIQLPPGVPAPPPEVLQTIANRRGNNTGDSGTPPTPGSPSTPTPPTNPNTNPTPNPGNGSNTGGGNTGNSGNNGGSNSNSSGGPPTFIPGAPPSFTPPSR